MKNTKKIIISLCISLVILCCINFVYNRVCKDKEVVVKVLTEDVYKGEQITESIIQNIKIRQSSDVEKYSNVNISGKVATKNIIAGKILENSDITEQNLEEKETEYEYVTIDIKNASDGVSYQLQKGDKVSLYYTVKNKEINTEETAINNMKDMITIKIFEEIEVIGLFDTMGNEIKDKGQYATIMFRVDKTKAMMIANIKSEGTFSVALIK